MHYDHKQRYIPESWKGLKVKIINLRQDTAGREHRTLHHAALDKQQQRHNCHQEEFLPFLREEHKGRAINAYHICHDIIRENNAYKLVRKSHDVNK